MEKFEIVLGIYVEKARSAHAKIWNEWQNWFEHHKIKSFRFACEETMKPEDADVKVT